MIEMWSSFSQRKQWNDNRINWFFFFHLFFFLFCFFYFHPDLIFLFFLFIVFFKCNILERHQKVLSWSQTELKKYLSSFDRKKLTNISYIRFQHLQQYRSRVPNLKFTGHMWPASIIHVTPHPNVKKFSTVFLMLTMKK